MRCVQSSAFFRITWVFSAFFGLLLWGCGSGSLAPTRDPITVTREASVPWCKEVGFARLTHITAGELSPEEPLSRSSMQEISDAASRLGANYIVVNSTPVGPQAFGFKC